MKIKAFTLIELIVVLVILGILAALAIPTFNALKAGAAASTALRSAESVAREANGLAALASVATDDTHVNSAGGDLTTGTSLAWDAATNKITITAGGQSGIAYVCLVTGVAVGKAAC